MKSLSVTPQHKRLYGAPCESLESSHGWLQNGTNEETATIHGRGLTLPTLRSTNALRVCTENLKSVKFAEQLKLIELMIGRISQVAMTIRRTINGCVGHATGNMTGQFLTSSQ